MTQTITLRARLGSPLADPRVRDTVRAAAEAIAERTGVALGAIDTEPDRITIEVHGGRIEAVGLAAELRRVTNAWFRGRRPGESLWGEDPQGEGEAGE